MSREKCCRNGISMIVSVMLTHFEKQSMWSQIGGTYPREVMPGDHRRLNQQIKCDLRSLRGQSVKEVCDDYDSIIKNGLRPIMQHATGRVISSSQVNLEEVKGDVPAATVETTSPQTDFPQTEPQGQDGVQLFTPGSKVEVVETGLAVSSLYRS